MKSCALVTTPKAWWVPAVLQLVHHELGLVHADRHERRRSAVAEIERGQHVADRDRVQRGGDEDGAGGLHGMLPHRVLRLERVAEDAGQRAVVADRPGEHEGHLVADQRVHDAALDEPGLDRTLDGADRPHLVDGAHVKAVSALGGLAGVAHAQRGAEDRRLDIVHGDRVPRQHRLHVAVPDEPLEVRPGPRVHQRGPDHPDEVAAAPLLLPQPGGQLLVVHRPLAAHLGGHEAKLVGAVGAAEEALGVDHDPFAAVLRLAHRHQLALPRRRGSMVSRTVRPLHDHAVHARPLRARPSGRPRARRWGGSRSRRSPRAARRRRAAARSAPRASRRRGAGRNRATCRDWGTYAAGRIGERRGLSRMHGR